MAAIIPAKSAISPHVTALRVFVMPTLPKQRLTESWHRKSRKNSRHATSMQTET